MSEKLITIGTRRSIADALTIGGLRYSGRLDEPDFLNRLYDLGKMKSNDYRYDNAYGDIHKHTVLNDDWDSDWVFTDNRFNLNHCDDEEYLKFLSETIHPAVQYDSADVEKMLGIYNQYLRKDGYEMIQVGDISGRPVFAATKIGSTHSSLAANNQQIKQYLNTSYVNAKIQIMTDALASDSDLAIGTAKELLETCCKSILKQKGINIDSDWTLPRLIKETSNSLDFKPKEADDPAKAEQSIKQILGGITTIVQGVTELRNAYGTGHGKDADFKGLETKYAKLLVGVVSEIAIIFLATNGENTELIVP